MGIQNYVGKKLDNLGSAAMAVAGGVGLAQFPSYLAQYIQRLGGHVDEAVRWGVQYADIGKRAAELKSGLEAIVGASGIGKLPAFVANIDWEIAKATLAHYTPGIALDAQGVAYLGAGALGGLVLYEGVKAGSKAAYKGAKRLLSKKKVKPTA
ncbi:MAG: DUF2937 family protein [Nanoarchaeota archaeon]|nr:DUF2937 family protein [Nanoarchaeota archaeon]